MIRSGQRLNLLYLLPVLIILLLLGIKVHFNCSHRNKRDLGVELQIPEGTKYNQPSRTNTRPDVVTITPWLAPVVWEGTFDPTMIDAIYKKQNITVATTIFALGKYTRFLKDFFETAEKNFFLHYKVHYYLFTDRPDDVPVVTLSSGRNLMVLKTESSNRWQEITLRRMERIEKLIEERLIDEVDYIFCLDVDTKFHGPWGTETLSDIVATLHPGYYKTPRNKLPYERRSRSRAMIRKDEGDYYYGGAVFGGRVDRVLRLTRTCRTQLDEDRENQIEAIWQEESHLNKYFLYNKPTKVLSPEYLWQYKKVKNTDVKVIRFSQVYKKKSEIRPNP